jgi:hypothetical protein
MPDDVSIPIMHGNITPGMTPVVFGDDDNIYKFGVSFIESTLRIFTGDNCPLFVRCPSTAERSNSEGSDVTIGMSLFKSLPFVQSSSDASALLNVDVAGVIGLGTGSPIQPDNLIDVREADITEGDSMVAQKGLSITFPNTITASELSDAKSFPVLDDRSSWTGRGNVRIGSIAHSSIIRDIDVNPVVKYIGLPHSMMEQFRDMIENHGYLAQPTLDGGLYIECGLRLPLTLTISGVAITVPLWTDDDGHDVKYSMGTRMCETNLRGVDGRNVVVGSPVLAGGRRMIMDRSGRVIRIIQNSDDTVRRPQDSVPLMDSVPWFEAPKMIMTEGDDIFAVRMSSGGEHVLVSKPPTEDEYMNGFSMVLIKPSLFRESRVGRTHRDKLSQLFHLSALHVDRDGIEISLVVAHDETRTSFEVEIESTDRVVKISFVRVDTIVEGPTTVDLPSPVPLKLNDEPIECIICQEIIEEGRMVNGVGCDHVFHAECFKRWTDIGKVTCPTCRRTPVKKPHGKLLRRSPSPR